jgi:hypothetical protein
MSGLAAVLPQLPLIMIPDLPLVGALLSGVHSMTCQGALIEEQGATLAIAIRKKPLLDRHGHRVEAVSTFPTSVSGNPRDPDKPRQSGRRSGQGHSTR